MATHRQHEQKETAYFITFTCHQWLPLFEIAQAYSAIDKWFEYLKNNHVSILGYVKMPNHFHGILYIDEKCSKTLNQLVSNGKRFLAYEIVKKLQCQGQVRILEQLQNSVSDRERAKQKKHQVFRPSFDAKECFNEKMINVKLDYIHHNPVQPGWNLVEDFTLYPHSSANYYENGGANKLITHYKEFF